MVAELFKFFLFDCQIAIRFTLALSFPISNISSAKPQITIISYFCTPLQFSIWHSYFSVVIHGRNLKEVVSFLSTIISTSLQGQRDILAEQKEHTSLSKKELVRETVVFSFVKLGQLCSVFTQIIAHFFLFLHFHRIPSCH